MRCDSAARRCGSKCYDGSAIHLPLVWLIERRVKAVGYDYPPDYHVRTGIFEPGRRVPREEHTTHFMFFPAGITVIEYLTNLDAIGVTRCRFVALPLRIEGADGSPVRAIALVD